jgi:hypothetical protein
LKKEHLDILETLRSMEVAGTLDSASFTDIPIQVYHHPLCPGISSSAIKAIHKNSIRRWKTEKFTGNNATRFGNAYHCFVSEPHIFKEEYVIVPNHRTKAPEGKIAVSDSELTLLTKMQTKLSEHPEASILMNGARFETSFFSRDSRTGILKKCRWDLWNQLESRIVVGDFKTCEDASEGSFTYDAKKWLYRISAAFYLEVGSEVLGQTLTDFRLIACEKQEPYDVNVLPVSQRSLIKASTEIRDVLDQLQKFNEQRDKAWTGYKLNQQPIEI